MTCRIEIRRADEAGTTVGRVACFSTQTVADAIALTQVKTRSAPRSAHPLNIDVFDCANRLILSYVTSYYLKIVH